VSNVVQVPLHDAQQDGQSDLRGYLAASDLRQVAGHEGRWMM
jgi:hypothetical protein